VISASSSAVPIVTVSGITASPMIDRQAQ